MLLPYAPGQPELTAAYLEHEVGVAPHLLPRQWKAFAGRIIFPVRDKSGYLVGFGGRTAASGTDPTEAQPKYVNSSAASGFRKGEVLYGLYRAKEAIAESGRVFVVEGYRDVLAMCAAGYANTVALCGTALAEGQVRLLKSLKADVTLLMDGDEAGRRAAARCATLLQADGMTVQVVHLSDGDDPDYLFRSVGKEAFRRRIDLLVSPHDETEERLVTLLLMYPDAVVRLNGDHYVFPQLIASMLVTDHISLVNAYHRQLLNLLQDAATETGGGDRLKSVATSLIERNQPVLAAMAAQRGLSANYKEEETERFTDFAFHYLREYYEARLYSQIRDITKSVCSNAIAEREANLLAELDERRDFFSQVSRQLDRTGAVVD